MRGSNHKDFSDKVAKEKHPDFIIVGTQKGGTTSLYKYLIQHPQVQEARKKEIHFFSQSYSQGMDWYLDHFPSKQQSKNEKSIDNVLATTKDNLNEWVTVKANVKEDFKKFHDLDVNELDGLAIMADTDNSKMKSISYFQNIYFSVD